MEKRVGPNAIVTFQFDDGLRDGHWTGALSDDGGLGGAVCNPDGRPPTTGINLSPMMVEIDVGNGKLGGTFLFQTSCSAMLSADAGPDQTDVPVGMEVTLDASQSSSPAGATFDWDLLSKPSRSSSYIPQSGQFVSFPFTIDEPGVYQFRVTVSVNGRSDSDEMTVTTAPPTISQVSPVMGPPGQPVVVIGADFSPSSDGNEVRFDGVLSPHTVLNAGEIHTTVPNGAMTGPVTVTVVETQEVATSPNDFTVTPPLNPWTFQPNPAADDYRSVSFADATTGMMAGVNRNVFRTTDGGTTWTAVTALPSIPVTNAFGIAMPSLDTAYVVGIRAGGGGVVRTADGGISAWTPVRDVAGESYRAVHFIDHREGWVVGANGVIIHTNDAGATWTTQTSNTSQLLYSVVFVDNLNGVAVGDGGTITRTTDGGTTWVATTTGAHRLNDVTFADAMNGLIVGRETGVSPFNVVLFRTTTGVAGWAQVMNHGLPVNNDVWAIAYPTTSVAYLHGDGPGSTDFFYRSTDGGQTWTQEQGTGNSGPSFFDILMLDATNGVAVGDQLYAYRR